ncbi:MAG: RecBCD enzyme subunit RecC [Chlamydiales bacterium]|nr:RecBCD enzyme subunit RecC [Chlamydiales bacterium]
MENWIRMHLANHLTIAAGITTSFLDHAIHELFESEPFPSRLELTLRIEEAMDRIQQKWEPLLSYTRGKKRRMLLLSRELATLFNRYGVYGQIFCGQWEKEPQNWQEALWQEVFSTCNYPLQMLPKLKTQASAASIHLFSFSHIPPLYFHFFQQLSGVHFYQLSPCQEFWSDLSHAHPHLTYFGKVGREMARLVEESDLMTEECYAFSEAETQLQRLQQEWLNLETTEKVEDDSLQLHISQTEHHEVQNLHTTLLNLLEAEPGLEPKDILVMAPDITRYAPYVEAVFKGSLPYQIADMPMQHHHPQIEGLFSLLELEKNRFSAPAVLDLFHHPLFQKKRGWSEEDLLQIRNWIEATGIRWGLDSAHRDALLKQRQCEKGVQDEGSTWKAGIDHLLEELAIPYSPGRIDFTQAELLGEWKQVLDQLSQALELLHETLPLREWVNRLIALHTTFFAESDQVAIELEQLGRAGRFSAKRTYSFATIEPLLRDSIGEKSVTIHAHLIQAVRFCSLLPMRAIPSKILCLLGMNHDTFPRKDNLFSLDLIKNKGDYAPSRLDFDRYLFLEAVLSARAKLLISYIGSDPFDQTPWPPSSVVTQLLPYISKTVKHPTVSPVKDQPEQQPALFTFHPQRIEIPSCQIDMTDFVRAFRAPLRHYLHHRNLYIRDEKVVQGEEAFHLSALNRAILRKQSAAGDALLKARKEGVFPIGALGILAQKQLAEEMALIPPHLESSPVDLTVDGVQLVGTLDSLIPKGLCALERKNMKGAVRSWPLFLIATATRPETSSLLFVRDGKKVERFFDDPTPYLRNAIAYYFLSKQMPSPLFPDWVEPILKDSPKKLALAASYDASLKWALRGQKPLLPDELVAQWKEKTETLYKEMADAWF